jgi:hypothetical protein
MNQYCSLLENCVKTLKFNTCNLRHNCIDNCKVASIAAQYLRCVHLLSSYTLTLGSWFWSPLGEWLYVGICFCSYVLCRYSHCEEWLLRQSGLYIFMNEVYSWNAQCQRTEQNWKEGTSLHVCHYYCNIYYLWQRTHHVMQMAQKPLVSQGLLIVEASWWHSDTPHLVGLLWTGDQPVAQTSTRQHTILTRDWHPCSQRDSNPQS